MIALLDCIITAFCLAKLAQSNQVDTGSINVSRHDKQQGKFEESANTTDPSQLHIDQDNLGTDLFGSHEYIEHNKAGKSKGEPGLERKAVVHQRSLEPPVQMEFQKGLKLLDWKRRRKRMLASNGQIRQINEATDKSIQKYLKGSKNTDSKDNTTNEDFGGHKSFKKPLITERTRARFNSDSVSYTTEGPVVQGVKHSISTPNDCIDQHRNIDFSSPQFQNAFDQYMEALKNISNFSIHNDKMDHKTESKSTTEYVNGTLEDATKGLKESFYNYMKLIKSKVENLDNTESRKPGESISSILQTESKFENMLSDYFMITKSSSNHKCCTPFSIMKNKTVKEDSNLTIGRCKANKSKSNKVPTMPKKQKKLSLFERIMLINRTAFETTSNHMGFVTCVTPPHISPGISQTSEHQMADCHPKGSGPLCPLSNDKEMSGAKLDEELEDALTGKLADRVVEVVMAKMSKESRMVDELGLSPQANLTSMLNKVTHPSTKQHYDQQASENLKLSVLQEIAAAVDRLTIVQPTSEVCLKPPGHLMEFLAWLSTENSDEDMPKPPPETNHQQRRRDAYYIFRSKAAQNQEPSSFREKEPYDWDDWMIYKEDSSPDELNYNSESADDYESRNQKRQMNVHKRRDRRSGYRRHRATEHRTRYTPWSLIDFP